MRIENTGKWLIDEQEIDLQSPPQRANAVVEEDVPAPQLITLPWKVYSSSKTLSNDDVLTEDSNVRISVIDCVSIILKFYFSRDTLQNGVALLLKDNSISSQYFCWGLGNSLYNKV